MFYQGLGIGLAIIALLVLLAALRFILHRGWFMAWLKGTGSLIAIFVAIGLALSAADLYSYHAITQETTVANVSVRETGKQTFTVRVALPDQDEQQFEVKGDLWQLDARVITWKGPLSIMQPGYRLDRLSGRYISLEQERLAERSVYEVQSSNFGIDLWSLLRSQDWVPWVDANYGAATYMPLKSGAEYVVSLSNKGMLARPLNSVAVDAVESWQ